jgi:hypothetical protein
VVSDNVLLLARAFHVAQEDVESEKYARKPIEAPVQKASGATQIVAKEKK